MTIYEFINEIFKKYAKISVFLGKAQRAQASSWIKIKNDRHTVIVIWKNYIKTTIWVGYHKTDGETWETETEEQFDDPQKALEYTKKLLDNPHFSRKNKNTQRE